MASKITERQLVETTDYVEYEKFCHDLMVRVGYEHIEPMGGSNDKGRDAIYKSVKDGKNVIFAFSVEVKWERKLDSDLKKVKKHKHPCEKFVFVTTSRLSSVAKDKWKKEVSNKYGWELELWDLERIAIEVDYDNSLKRLHPSIFDREYGDGDSYSELKDHLNAETTRTLKGINVTIPGIDATLSRQEVTEIIQALSDGNNILVTGEGGSGKSGISKLLISAMRQDTTFKKLTFLLDARKLLGITDDDALGHYLGFNNSLLTNIERLSQPDGCILIIDQLDNIEDSKTRAYLLNLIERCLDIHGLQLVGIVRSWGDGKIGPFEKLISEYKFQKVISKPISKDESRAILIDSLRVADPSDELIELCTNLLNLSLVSDLIQEHHSINLIEVESEAELWEKYIHSLRSREGPIKEDYPEILEEAVKLSKVAIQSGEVKLPIDKSFAQSRLISRGIIENVEGRIYKFRHDKILKAFVAWDSAEQGLHPRDIVDQGIQSGLGEVLRWTLKFYINRNSKFLLTFIKKSIDDIENNFDFFTKAQVVAEVATNRLICQNLSIMDEVLVVLNRHPALLHYFFQSHPEIEWGSRLYSANFFDKINDGVSSNQTEIFDLLNYLKETSTKNPLLLHNIINKVRTKNPFTFRGLIDAIIPMAPEEQLKEIEWASQWIVDTRLGQSDFVIMHQLGEWIDKLISHRKSDAALKLIASLINPVPFDKSDPSHYSIKYNEVAKINPYLFRRLIENQVISISKFDLNGAVSVFHSAIQLTIAHESDGDSEQRKHIEMSVPEIRNLDMEHSYSYLDRLLAGLRDLLLASINEDSKEVRELICALLCDIPLFHELAIHIIRKKIEIFRNDAKNILLREEQSKLDSDEYRLLLKQCFLDLLPVEQEKLIKIIRSGPDDNSRIRVEKRTQRMKDIQDPIRHVQEFVECWILRILFPIKEHLTGDNQAFITELVNKYGEPRAFDEDREVHTIIQRGPASVSEMSIMNSKELSELLLNWVPSKDSDIPFVEYSLSGLSSDLISVVKNCPELGVSVMEYTNMRKLRPCYIKSIFLALREVVESGYKIALDRIIPILMNAYGELVSSISEDSTFSNPDDNEDARRYLAWFLFAYINSLTEPIPEEFRHEIKQIIETMLKDPGTANGLDQDGKHPSAADDYIIAAYSNVRAWALRSAICYILNLSIRATTCDDGQSIGRMQYDWLKGIMSDKVDYHNEPSETVHSIFGMCLSQIKLIDDLWYHENLELIFAQDEAYFKPTWYLYIIINKPRKVIFLDLSAYYERGFRYLYNQNDDRLDSDYSQQYIYHLLFAYLNNSEEVEFPVSLIKKIYDDEKDIGRSTTMRIIWLMFKDGGDILHYWPKIRELLEMEITVIKERGYPQDMSNEMVWFFHWPYMVRNIEPIESLYPLIEEAIPSLKGVDVWFAWDELEKYILDQSTINPELAIHLYRLMHELSGQPDYLKDSLNAREIVENTINKSRKARIDALAIINWLGTHGDYRLKDLHDKYSNMDLSQ